MDNMNRVGLTAMRGFAYGECSELHHFYLSSHKPKLKIQGDKGK